MSRDSIGMPGISDFDLFMSQEEKDRNASNIYIIKATKGKECCFCCKCLKEDETKVPLYINGKETGEFYCVSCYNKLGED